MASEDSILTAKIFSHMRLETGNLLHFHGDALVIDATPELRYAPGASRAVFEAAGESFAKEAEGLGKQDFGKAIALPGKNLDRVTHVILTVPPLFKKEDETQAEVMASCYRNAFKIAKEKKLYKLAFASVGTWVYNYPRFPAAKIALLEAVKFLIDEGEDSPFQFVFYCFDKTTFRNYGTLMNLLIEELGEGKRYGHW